MKFEYILTWEQYYMYMLDTRSTIGVQIALREKNDAKVALERFYNKVLELEDTICGGDLKF